MYNYVAHSVSSDLKTFSTPILITEKDNAKNFCSPGNAFGYRYIVFFHGSRADSYPETHGAASLAYAYTNDFEQYYF